MKNCPNCGAPFELNEYKCPYCGTLYLDLSMIDFDNRTPIFLSIKRNGYLITQKVLPQTADFEVTSDEVYAVGGRGNKLCSFIRNNTLETNIQFIAIPDEHNSLCTVTKKEN